MTSIVTQVRKRPEKGPRGSNVSAIYNVLRKEIISLELRPGATLDEVGLSQRFNLSRSPVREAIIRLTGEGLVTVLPNRSAIVSELDLRTLPSFLDALELMQRVVTRLAAANRTEKHLADMAEFERLFVQAQGERDFDAMLAANYGFHMSVAEAGGNVYFKALYSRLLDEAQRLLMLNYQTNRPSGQPTQAEEHDAIIHAIESRDADAADRCGYLHAIEFRQNVLRQLQVSSMSNIILS